MGTSVVYRRGRSVGDRSGRMGLLWLSQVVVVVGQGKLEPHQNVVAGGEVVM